MGRIIQKSLSFLAVGAVLAGFCSGAQAASMTVAMGSEPTSLDPQLVQDGGEWTVNDNIFEALLIRTADGQLQTGLAADIPTRINPTTWRVKLRPGIKFSNGESFNADAVVHSVNRIVDPNFKSRQLPFFSPIAKADKVDDLTVDVLTKGPDPALMTRLYYLKIVPVQASQAPDFANKPVGTGPYRFVEWTKGQKVVLERNPDYWGPKPEIERVIFRFIKEPGTRLSGLQAGEFDFVHNLLPEFVKDVPQAVSTTGPLLTMIELDSRKSAGVTSDVRVRKALNLAVDKNALAQSLFEGFASVADGQILESNWFGYNPNIKAYPYNPQAARKLLKEAGAEGATIDIYGSNGRWLKDREITEAVAGYWEAIGLKVNVHIVEFSEYLDRLNDQKARPQTIFIGHSNQLFDADRTDSAYLEPGRSGASNDNAEIGDLIKAARTEIEVTKRENLYRQIGQIAYDDAMFVFLLYHKDIFGLSKNLRWQPRADGKVLIKEITLAK
ncbi:MAG TPA: ABC transporter substrate-binding protein [Telmatospirillum sp.]|nr:ABC transporter substrate-binding protein [Telmatospirillum sp.]